MSQPLPHPPYEPGLIVRRLPHGCKWPDTSDFPDQWSGQVFWTCPECHTEYQFYSRGGSGAARWFVSDTVWTEHDGWENLSTPGGAS